MAGLLPLSSQVNIRLACGPLLPPQNAFFLGGKVSQFMARLINSQPLWKLPRVPAVTQWWIINSRKRYDDVGKFMQSIMHQLL